MAGKRKGKIEIKATAESHGSKARRTLSFSWIAVFVAIFMVFAGASIGKSITPPNAAVLQNQKKQKYYSQNFNPNSPPVSVLSVKSTGITKSLKSMPIAFIDWNTSEFMVTIY